MSKRNMRIAAAAGILLLAGFTGNAHAAWINEKGPAQKFTRGFVYLVASPFQVPKEILQTAAQAEPAWMAPWEGMTIGLGKGGYNFGRQVAAGLFDMCTFRSPAERNWEPLFKSEILFPEI